MRLEIQLIPLMDLRMVDVLVKLKVHKLVVLWALLLDRAMVF